MMDDAQVTQEEKENDAGENKADENGVAHTGDGFANELGLIVEGNELRAFGQDLLELQTWSATRSATSTVLLEGWRVMLSRTASFPSAFTVCRREEHSGRLCLRQRREPARPRVWF